MDLHKYLKDLEKEVDSDSIDVLKRLLLKLEDLKFGNKINCCHTSQIFNILLFAIGKYYLRKSNVVRAVMFLEFMKENITFFDLTSINKILLNKSKRLFNNSKQLRDNRNVNFKNFRIYKDAKQTGNRIEIIEEIAKRCINRIVNKKQTKKRIKNRNKTKIISIIVTKKQLVENLMKMEMNEKEKEREERRLLFQRRAKEKNALKNPKKALQELNNKREIRDLRVKEQENYFKQKQNQLTSDIDTLIEQNPNKVNNYLTKAQILEKNDYATEALEVLEKAILRNPTYAEAYCMCALIFMKGKEKKIEESLDYLVESLKYCPQFTIKYCDIICNYVKSDSLKNEISEIKHKAVKAKNNKLFHHKKSLENKLQKIEVNEENKQKKSVFEKEEKNKILDSKYKHKSHPKLKSMLKIETVSHIKLIKNEIKNYVITKEIHDYFDCLDTKLILHNDRNYVINCALKCQTFLDEVIGIGCEK